MSKTDWVISILCFCPWVSTPTICVCCHIFFPTTKVSLFSQIWFSLPSIWSTTSFLVLYNFNNWLGCVYFMEWWPHMTYVQCSLVHPSPILKSKISSHLFNCHHFQFLLASFEMIQVFQEETRYTLRVPNLCRKKRYHIQQQYFGGISNGQRSWNGLQFGIPWVNFSWRSTWKFLKSHGYHKRW